MSNTLDPSVLVTQQLDVSCLEDLDTYGAELTDPLAVYEQDVFHVLIETPGSNTDDPDRGIGIEDLCSGSITAGQLQMTIQTELLKDARALSVTVDVEITQDNGQTGQAYEIDITIQTNQGVLQLEVLVDSNGVSIQ